MSWAETIGQRFRKRFQNKVLYEQVVTALCGSGPPAGQLCENNASWGLPAPAMPPRYPAPRGGGHLPRQPSNDAGWSSPVARQAHNLKVVSSNLAPATKTRPAVSMRWRAVLLLASAMKVALGYTWVTGEKEVAGCPQKFVLTSLRACDPLRALVLQFGMSALVVRQWRRVMRGVRVQVDRGDVQFVSVLASIVPSLLVTITLKLANAASADVSLLWPLVSNTLAMAEGESANSMIDFIHYRPKNIQKH
jgi:hypothetical protein